MDGMIDDRLDGTLATVPRVPAAACLAAPRVATPSVGAVLLARGAFCCWRAALSAAGRGAFRCWSRRFLLLVAALSAAASSWCSRHLWPRYLVPVAAAMLQPAALLSMPRIPHARAANLRPVHGVPRVIKPAPRWVSLLSLHTIAWPR
jgi:hypothetical protein